MLKELFEKLKSTLQGSKTKRLSLEPVSVYLPKSKDIKARLVDPRFPRSVLLEIEKAVFTNPILSQIHNLVINLANTGHTVEVETVEVEREELKTEIDTLAQALNMDALVNALFSQIILYGALSAEIVVSPKVDGVERIARVHPATIYFAYDEEKDSWKPYQVVSDKTIELNPYTYQYIPLLTIDGSQYGIPPMLSALSLLETTDALISELQGLAKKLGLLGFLDISFPLLPRSAAETETEYQERARKFLQNTAQDIVENISKGILLHFDGTQVEFKELSSNTSGLKDVLATMEKWLIEGAKGQPALLGFAEGYTETWATVSLHIFISQLKNYQRLVERFLEYVYKLHLTLRGYSFKDVNVSFAEPPSFQAKVEEEVRKLRAETVIQLYQAGLITQEEARMLLEEVLL